VAVLQGFTRGLEALHSKGIFHRDLKLENILLSRLPTVGGFGKEDVKIADLGYALCPENRHENTSDMPSTFPYTPPELVELRAERFNLTQQLLNKCIEYVTSVSMTTTSTTSPTSATSATSGTSTGPGAGLTTAAESLRTLAKKHAADKTSDERDRLRDNQAIDEARKLFGRLPDVALVGRFPIPGCLPGCPPGCLPGCLPDFPLEFQRMHTSTFAAWTEKTKTLDWACLDTYSAAITMWKLLHEDADPYPNRCRKGDANLKFALALKSYLRPKLVERDTDVPKSLWSLYEGLFKGGVLADAWAHRMEDRLSAAALRSTIDGIISSLPQPPGDAAET